MQLPICSGSRSNCGAAFFMQDINRCRFIQSENLYLYTIYTMRNISLRQLRDNHIRQQFTTVRKKNPKWTIIAVIEEVATSIYLSPVTVAKILKEHNVDVPCADTVKKYSNLNY
jgi:hypothetical protein